jgi:hypothetical protein
MYWDMCGVNDALDECEIEYNDDYECDEANHYLEDNCSDEDGCPNSSSEECCDSMNIVFSDDCRNSKSLQLKIFCGDTIEVLSECGIDPSIVYEEYDPCEVALDAIFEFCMEDASCWFEPSDVTAECCAGLQVYFDSDNDCEFDSYYYSDCDGRCQSGRECTEQYCAGSAGTCGGAYATFMTDCRDPETSCLLDPADASSSSCCESMTILAEEDCDLKMNFNKVEGCFTCADFEECAAAYCKAFPADDSGSGSLSVMTVLSLVVVSLFTNKMF